MGATVGSRGKAPGRGIRVPLKLMTFYWYNSKLFVGWSVYYLCTTELPHTRIIINITKGSYVPKQTHFQWGQWVASRLFKGRMPATCCAPLTQINYSMADIHYLYRVNICRPAINRHPKSTTTSTITAQKYNNLSRQNETSTAENS